MVDIRKPVTTLRPPPRFGCFLWWPIPGQSWIHEDDLFVAEHLIPGKRIFRCETDADGWNQYQYGRLSFRARPSMWTELERPAHSLGEFVEVQSRMGKNRPLVAMIREVFWDRTRRRAQFQLSIAGRRLIRLYSADELVLSARIGTMPDHARRLGELRSGGYLAELSPDAESLHGPELVLAPEAT